jgi:carboxymethylenebutenolidase
MGNYLLVWVSIIIIVFLTACAASPSPTPKPTIMPTSTVSTVPGSTSTPASTPVLAPLVPSTSPLPNSSPSTAAPPGYVNPEAVDSAEVTFKSDTFDIKAYRSKPKSAGSFPGLIIIHENRGLTPHIQDVARRFANQGYLALAPDLLSRIGGISPISDHG